MHADSHLHVLYLTRTPDILEPMLDILDGEGFRVTTQSYLDRDLDAVVALAPRAIFFDDMWHQSDDEWVFLMLLTLNPRTSDIPIILCTGAMTAARVLEAHLVPRGIRVVLKPFRIEHLVRVVNEVLDERADPDSSHWGG